MKSQGEVMTFLRYTLPGLSSVLVFLFLLWITDRSCVTNLLAVAGKNNGLGTAAGLFLGSGALGYILANLYHALVWSRWMDKVATYDFTEWLNGHIEAKRLIIRDMNAGCNNMSTVTKRREVWEIVNLLYYRFYDHPKQDRYDNFIMALVSMVHSLGATILGILLAAGCWALVYYAGPFWELGDNPSKEFFALALVLVVELGLIVAWHRALRTVERLTRSAMELKIRRDADFWSPVEVHYWVSESPLDRRQRKVVRILFLSAVAVVLIPLLRSLLKLSLVTW